MKTQAPRHPYFPLPVRLEAEPERHPRNHGTAGGNVRIAIVEDRPAERELIATMCAEYFNGRNVGATAGRCHANGL